MIRKRSFNKITLLIFDKKLEFEEMIDILKKLEDEINYLQ